MSVYITAVEAALATAVKEHKSTPCQKAIVAVASNPIFTESAKTKYIGNIRCKYHYIIDEAKTAIRTAYDEYVKRLDAALAETENNFIDSEVVVRLSSELISVSTAEFYELVNQYKNNRLMQEVLAKYAAKNRIPYNFRYVSREEKINLAHEIMEKAFRELGKIGYAICYLSVSDEVKKILNE